MKFLSTILVLAGYTLIYAAVAKHGKFHANPWMGIFRDAYGVDSSPQQGESTLGANTGSNNSPKPPVRRRTTP